MTGNYKNTAFTAKAFSEYCKHTLGHNWPYENPNLSETRSLLKRLEQKKGEDFKALLDLEKSKFGDSELYRACIDEASRRTPFVLKWPMDKKLLFLPNYFSSTHYLHYINYLRELFIHYLPDGMLEERIRAAKNWDKLQRHLKDDYIKKIFSGERKGKVMQEHYWMQARQNPSIQYLNEVERDEREIFIRPGSTALKMGARLIDKSGNLFDTSKMKTNFNGDYWAAFVISIAGKMYANSHINGIFHHSSFLRGAPVKAAGEIVVENGEIQAISCKSGHYRPDTQMLFYFLHWLHYRGYNLKGIYVQTNIANYEFFDAFELFQKRGVDAGLTPMVLP